MFATALVVCAPAVASTTVARTCTPVDIALDVCAPAVASTAVARTSTLVDVMLDVDDVCTLTSRLVAAHLMSSLEALPSPLLDYQQLE